MSHPPESNQGRPFLGVLMRCCHIYARLYFNASQEAYVGWCPRCAKQVRVEVVAEGGSDQRFFEAS